MAVLERDSLRTDAARRERAGIEQRGCYHVGRQENHHCDDAQEQRECVLHCLPQRGAEEAARELGVELLWDGPTDPDPAKQNEIIEAWITRGVDVIAVSAENPEAIASVLIKARRAGSDIITFDADTGPESREYFVNQATPEQIGYKLMDRAADATSGKGEFAVITSSLTAANQNEWLKYIEKRRATLYPGMKMAVLRGVRRFAEKSVRRNQYDF